ncbi:MAG: hypothetical protein LBV19_00375 [Streptococcaceae bacterium]|nr:hypothetical protein [Streptococcaceae bacterium]
MKSLLHKKFKIGYLPYQVYLVLLVSYIGLSLTHKLPNDFLGGVGILMVYALFFRKLVLGFRLLRLLVGRCLSSRFSRLF